MVPTLPPLDRRSETIALAVGYSSTRLWHSDLKLLTLPNSALNKLRVFKNDLLVQKEKDARFQAAEGIYGICVSEDLVLSGVHAWRLRKLAELDWRYQEHDIAQQAYTAN
jgi:hypothetical protein